VAAVPVAAGLVARLRSAGCVFAEDEAALLLDAARLPEAGAPDGVDGAALEALVARRVAGEPLEHVLGWAELAGRRWSVGPGVFVPRRRSELLVDVGAGLLPAGGAAGPSPVPAVVLDLCCGCGAVGGALLVAARARGTAVELHASDLDPVATAHAVTNVGPLGGTVHTGDLFALLPPGLRGRVDVLLCHAPYVPTGTLRTLPPEAREHEPVVALDGGDDGLDVVRRVAGEAAPWLAPGGSLIVEVGAGQVEAATAVMRAAGLTAAVVPGAAEDEPWDEPWDEPAAQGPPTAGGAGGLVVTGTLPR
jgi:release factor glutamine methyltransferase